MIVHMIGNAHIDPVWLWPWQDGVDEALATFRSAVDRCEEYPEFVFTRGEAWVYQQVERIDPELFARVERLIERGQWHITGGQFLQPDSNLPTEMGWRRQILHGQRYFSERFGISPTIAYNVDSFGHPATLPDILADVGYQGFFFHRPGPHQVELPAQTFRWKGVSGGEVLGVRIIPSYTTTRVRDLGERVAQAIDATDPELGHAICFYGVGNHGGGPTKGNIDWILAHQDFAPGVELRFSTPQAFLDAVSTHRERLPEVTEELQKTFPGCYSVMHDIKQAQIRGEHLLDQAERVVNSYGDEAERGTELSRLDTAWEDLLFTEFHDILAGTSIPSAWKSVRAFQGRAWITGEEIIVDATRRWARRHLPTVDHQQIVVVNPDAAPRSGLIEAEPWLDFDWWGERWLSDLEGNPVPFQLVQPEAQLHVNRITFPLHLEAGGSTQLLVRDDPPPTSAPVIETDLDVSPRHLANGHLSLRLEPWGIGGLEVGGQQVLGADGWGLHLRDDRTDTWTFHTDRYDEPVRDRLDGDGWVVEETGPLRARVRLNGKVGNTPVRWTLTLNRDDPRLFLLLECTFVEQFSLLQMPIALATPPSRWTDGLPGGQVERAVGPTEWPVQGWSRVVVGDTELALVTNDVYSLSVPGGRWQWTLLRSPKMAWMEHREPPVYAGRDWHTDQGHHTFAFTLLTGETLPDELLHVAARQDAQPPIVFDRYEGLDRPRHVAQEPPEITESDEPAVP